MIERLILENDKNVKIKSMVHVQVMCIIIIIIIPFLVT